MPKTFNCFKYTTDLICLVVIATFSISRFPLSVFGASPATGGDTGSHFWPLYVLVNHSIQNFSFRSWNPGNLFGEPLFVHYFPFPYIIMLILNLFVSLGAAFNIGTVIPVVSLPIVTFFSLKISSFKFPGPLLGAVAALIFVYNESYSMWGGNGLSTLAGQFAHIYALNFLILGIGVLVWEYRRKKKPFLSGIIFAATSLSHSYLMIGIPFVILAFIVYFRKERPLRFLILGAVSCFICIMLSLWFLVPMVQNSRWNTAFFIRWELSSFISALIPNSFFVMLGSLPILVLFLCRKWKRQRGMNAKKIFGDSIPWFLISFSYLLMYFIFPKVGLVDVRTFPQIQIFYLIGLSQLLSRLFRQSLKLTIYLLIPFIFLLLTLVSYNTIKFDRWAKYNYDSWITKSGYKDFIALSNKIRGSFSEPRIAYEHSPVNSQIGTIRAFEMIPYFSNRAVTEGLYLQSTIMSPVAFLMQALISNRPSCPFAQYECVPVNLDKAIIISKLLGVGVWILSSDELIKKALGMPTLKLIGSFGSWSLFTLAEQPKLVEIMSKNYIKIGDASLLDKYSRFIPKRYSETEEDLTKLISPFDWKNLFYAWLKNYKTEDPLLVYEIENKELWLSNESFEEKLNCNPSVDVQFDRIKLITDCPGKAHILKFAFNPALKSSDGSNLFIVSPGFIGIVPNATDVTIDFKGEDSWFITGVLSFASWLVILIIAISKFCISIKHYFW